MLTSEELRVVVSAPLPSAEEAGGGGDFLRRHVGLRSLAMNRLLLLE